MKREATAIEKPFISEFVNRQIAYCEKRFGGAEVTELSIEGVRHQFKNKISDWVVVVIKTPQGNFREGVVVKEWIKRMKKEGVAA